MIKLDDIKRVDNKLVVFINNRYDYAIIDTIQSKRNLKSKKIRALKKLALNNYDLSKYEKECIFS